MQTGGHECLSGCKGAHRCHVCKASGLAGPQGGCRAYCLSRDHSVLCSQQHGLVSTFPRVVRQPVLVSRSDGHVTACHGSHVLCRVGECVWLTEGLQARDQPSGCEAPQGDPAFSPTHVAAHWLVCTLYTELMTTLGDPPQMLPVNSANSLITGHTQHCFNKFMSLASAKRQSRRGTRVRTRSGVPSSAHGEGLREHT
jgi:hypothetical protein